jgi:redox-regulated HSP33 family molecular chaperone
VGKNKELDDLNKDFLKWLEEEDPFGLDDDIKIIIFKCLDCGKEDEVPEYVVEEFHYDLKENEEVEVVCPFCNGTMRQARKDPSE